MDFMSSDLVNVVAAVITKSMGTTLVRYFKNKLGIGLQLSSLILCFVSTAVLADIDIRVASPLNPANIQTNYTLTVSDCSSVATIQAGTNSVLQSYSVADSRRDLSQPNNCLIDFSLAGPEQLAPAAKIVLIDGTRVEHSEQFSYDDLAPSINFKDVLINDTAGQQHLIVNVEAQDDVDIHYVGFNVVGLKASDLRTAGGVIAEARKTAFAQTDALQRIYPILEGQKQYFISLPLKENLSADMIAYDAIVLVEAYAVDASGNQNSLSKVAFTGDSIQEQAKSLVVSNNKILINNVLQTPVVNVAVDFQFRGVVDLTGPGNGVQFSSSHPELFGVTNGGVIYPLAETNGVSAFVTVTYPGLDAATIPVEIDFSKTLTSIQLKGYDANSPYILEKLNNYFALPELEGVFNDGTRAQISSSWSPIITVRSVYESVLEKNRLNQLRARAVIPRESPAYLDISLKELPNISSAIPLAAKDGLPSIVLTLPTTIQPPQELTVKANVEDDVGITNVQFKLDGAVIGNRASAPYELILPISEEMEGRTLALSAEVTDSAGQKQQSNDYSVQIVSRPKATVPAYQYELPIDGQRVVEQSPIVMQISSSLGILPDIEPRSGISHVEFFHDGTKVGEATFPLLESRKVIVNGKEEEELFELWLLRGNVPAVSTSETSLSISARIHAVGSATSDAPTKLVRVIENTDPVARIVAPNEGTSLTVGQQIPIVIEAADDTLALGTRVELYVNDKVVGSQTISDEETVVNSLAAATRQVAFNYTATAEQLGDTLRFRAKITDYHQRIGYSEILKINVTGDQPPTVSISNPTEGASFVSGLPIPIRANAVDDLEIEKVDFFVNAQLVGSDRTAPYAYIYDTQKGIEQEQILTIHAAATDSSGKRAESNAVKVTLGHDEERPVINFASPEINTLEAGNDVAEIIENSEFVLKVTGYDNVGVTRIELTGVTKSGAQYVLTGHASDKLTNEDFPLQQIPGALRAFSALRLVNAPAFSGSQNQAFDPYPVSVTVFDEIGNA